MDDPEIDEPDAELDLDVRSVSVIWQDDNEIRVHFSGCSAFEAIGLLRVGMRSLEDEYALADDEEDG